MTRAGITWKRAVADELARLYRPGEGFSLTDFYAQAEPRLQTIFPGSNTIRSTIRQILQKHRDAGLIQFHGNGRYTYPPGQPTASGPGVRLARAANNLAARIHNEEGIVASDYLEIAQADDPSAACRDLLTANRASTTFLALHACSRLDLSFEQLVIEQGKRLSLDESAVVAATHRLVYFKSDEENS